MLCFCLEFSQHELPVAVTIRIWTCIRVICSTVWQNCVLSLFWWKYIYIFELSGLIQICKELALLACRRHNTYQLRFQCVRPPAKRSPYYMNFDPAVWVDARAWLTDGGWMSVLAGQESEYYLWNESIRRYLNCSSVLPHIWDNVWFLFFLWQHCLSLLWITRSEYTVSTFRSFLLWGDVCSCAKCVNAIRSYTLWSFSLSCDLTPNELNSGRGFVCCGTS